MVVSENLRDSTLNTSELLIFRGWQAEGCLWQSTSISTILAALLWAHHVVRCYTSLLVGDETHYRCVIYEFDDGTFNGALRCGAIIGVKEIKGW